MTATAEQDPLSPNAIAVVGMALRFPGANSPSAFWQNLRAGEESIRTLTEAQLIDAGVSAVTLADPQYVRRAPIIDGIDEFDAEFFGFPPQVARMMDPQQRLFLQCAWHALEDAGCDPAAFDGSIGVFATSGASMYMLHNLLSHHDRSAFLGQGATFDLINMSLQNDKDYLATRVSHQFDLRGPSVTVQTACSSSMVAVHTACQSLLNGECDMVLAGGASIRIPHHVGYWHEPGSMVSGAGHCRPFDAAADGTVFGSGVAVIALKPLQAALEAGDRIHAVIRGSAINNDGAKKMTYAAPNGAAQADVIAEAQAVAGVDASSISYIEAHGTGTPLGDPIEMEALRAAFSLSDTPRSGPCLVGSVKSNIGHLAEASGIAGLIKTILCLKNRAIPATLHFTTANPALNLDRGPFTVSNECTPWEWDGVRRAGVSSFGVGGTNVHLVVEEAPAQPACPVQDGTQVLRLSARTPEALEDFRAAMAAELAADPALDLSDVAATLDRRRLERFRLAAVVHDRHDAAAVLGAAESDNVFVSESTDGTATSRAPAGERRVTLMFPGQGAQHADMARGLYESEPVFTEHFDRCAEGFQSELGIDLKAELFGSDQSDLERTDRAQPALFTVEYALARLLHAYGVQASAYVGHSIGEYVAGVLAGIFDLPTAIGVVATRARLMHGSARGAMVAVAMTPEAIAEHLAPGLDLAAVNDPGNCVVAGSPEDVMKFQNRLRQRGILARRVRTAHAFHSQLMDPVVPQFGEFLSGVQLRPPHTPVLSNVTGTWLTDAQATDPTLWAGQIRATVRFSDELDHVLDDPCAVLVEVGPGGALTGSAMRHPKWAERHRAVRLMRHQVQNRGDRDTFLLALGQLWSAGVEVDWSPLSSRTPTLVSLPGYPFVRQRHWVDPELTADGAAPVRTNGSTPNGHVVEPAGETKTGGAGTGQVDIESTLRRICAECLGVSSVGPNDDFFEIGGDSLIAIGVAMSATNQGLELTPQDLYDHPNVAALTAVLSARYAAGGLAAVSVDDAPQPVSPLAAHFLEHGLREAGRWRVPLLVRLDSTVGIEDVRSVLAAVINHHDALRTGFSQRAGAWEQQIRPPCDQLDIAQVSLPDTVPPGSDDERRAAIDILTAQVRRQDLSSPALAATYIADADGAGRYLAMSIHELVADGGSREILLTDLFTAFTQRLAGSDITLPPVTATWREWSQRYAGLATHPAVLDSRQYWLDEAAKPTLPLADRGPGQPPGADDMECVPSLIGAEPAGLIERARGRFEFVVEELMLGALSRTIAHSVAEGTVAVALAGTGRSVLKPDVDPRRTVGGFTTVYPVSLSCHGGSTATQVLDRVHETMRAVPHQGVGHGLLRYLYGPTARTFGAVESPDLLLCNEGVIPDLPTAAGPVQIDRETAMGVRDKTPGLGFPIEMRIYRSSAGMHVDWWYDVRRVAQATVKTMAERFPIEFEELLSEALATAPTQDEFGGAMSELGLVDLSAE